MNYSHSRRQRMLGRSFPALVPVETPVADVSDALDYPEIARAIEHARQLRKGL